MAKLTTKIGLEIHVQLKTKSKMFCRCDNDAQGKKPNTTVCPICLGMPGTLPVANKQAVLWTIKTGLAFNCEIPKIAKFDRKHYFYPDLPKGYQISQYDEPFCVGGYLDIDGNKVRLNRIHLEEDAGKLTHSGGKSLVDLNRAGTPLMEIVTEPDIKSPKQAGDFLRTLQKIVRDVVEVSDADMEKGHLRCDANISVSDEAGRMSEIVELKNINSFRFVEKALEIEEKKLNEEYPNWPEKVTKATHGYDSKKNITYEQRRKEEAADYRYFPEPDLPPFDTSRFDLEELRSGIQESESEKIEKLIKNNVKEADAKIILSNKSKESLFVKILGEIGDEYAPDVAKVIVQNYLPVAASEEKAGEYAKLIIALSNNQINKSQFSQLSEKIGKNEGGAEELLENLKEEGAGEDEAKNIIQSVLKEHDSEVQAYRNGKVQLLGFFMGEVMKKSAGKIDPKVAADILKSELLK